MAKQTVILRCGALLSSGVMLAACADTEYEVGVFKAFHVLAVEPAGGADNVPLEPTISVTLSDDLLASSLTDAAVYLLDTQADEHVPADLAYDDNAGAGPFVITFGLHPGLAVDPTPDDAGDDPLAFSRWYEVHLTTALTREAKPDRPLEQIDESGLPEEVVSGFRSEDPPPLRVLNTEPGQGTLGAAIDTALRITFSEAVDQTSVDAVAFAVEDITSYDPTGVVAGTFAFADSDPTKVLQTGDIVQFTPDPDLGYSRDIEVRLATTLQSTRATDRGGNLPEEVVFFFATEDPPPLELVASAPTAGAADVPLAASLTLDFSEALDMGSVPPARASILVQDITTGIAVDIAGTWTPGANAVLNDRLVFEPALDLPYAARIAVTLTTAVQSARATPRGGQLAAEVTIDFATILPPPLELVGTVPAAGNERVDQRTLLVLTFDRPVDPTSVSATSIRVEDIYFGTAVDGSYEAQGTSVTFTPTGDTFRLDADIEVALTIDLRSTAAEGGGHLAQPISFSFHVNPAPPLEVEAYTPTATTGVPVTVEPSVTFNTDIFEPTLPTGTVTAGASDTNLRLGACPGAYPCPCNQVTTVAGTVAYTPENKTAVFTPDTALSGTSTYQLCVSAGLVSLIGNPLVEELQVVFSTEATNQVDFTQPLPAATGVSATAVVRIYFDVGEALDAGSVAYPASLSVTHTDVFGRVSLVPGTVTTGTDGGLGQDFIEFVPDQDTQPCLESAHLLSYDTVYAVTLTDSVTTNGGTPVTGGLSFSFTTASAPYLVAASPEPGGSGFPVVNDLIVTLSGAVDPTTLTPTTVTLTDGDANPVLLQSISLDPVDSSTIIIVVDPTPLDYGHLLFGETYTLTLLGGPQGAPAGATGVALLGDDGGVNHLVADEVIAFRTVIELIPQVAPYTISDSIPPNSSVAVMFGRPLDVSTLTADRFKVVDCGAVGTCNIPCAVDDTTHSTEGLRSYTDDLETAIFIPTPQLTGIRKYTVAVAGRSFGSSPITDIWGNPLDTDFSFSFCTSGGPNNAGPIGILTSPANLASDAAADTQVVVSFDKDMSPDGMTCGGLYVREDTTTTNLCRGLVYEPTQKRAVITVSDPSQGIYLRGAVVYNVGLTELVADLQLNAGTPGDVGSFTVEAVAPTLVDVVPADTDSEVPGDSTITMTFDEPMKVASFVTGVTFTASDSMGNTVNGTFTTSGNDVIFTPASPLSGNETYTVTLTGVTDLGGTALVVTPDPYTLSFTTDTQAPDISSAVFNSPDTVVITFSEAMAPAGVTASDTTTAGSIQLLTGNCATPGAEIFGCLELDATGTIVTFDPSPDPDDAAAVLAGEYCVVVTTASTDTAGIALALEYTQTITTP